MKKFLIVLGCIFLFFMLSIAFLWLFRKPIMSSVSQKAISALQKDMGREIKMHSLEISSDSGITLSKVCVSQKPDFKKGTFFCSDKIKASADLSTSGENKISFKEVILENAEININEENGHWDFEDLSVNSTQKGNFEDSWPIDRLILKNAKLAAKSASRDLDAKMENSNLVIEHEGKNFAIKGNALFMSELNGSQVKIPADINIKTAFNDGELSEASGEASFAKASLGRISLEKLAINANISGMEKETKYRNIILRFSAEGLIIPYDDSLIYEKVPQYLKLFAAAVGRPAPVIKNAEIHNAKGHLRLEKNSVGLQHFSLRSNFMEMDGDMSINGNTGRTSASSKISIGKNSIGLRFSGPYKNPSLDPLLADTLSRKLKASYIDFEEYILGYFPVMEN